MNIHSCDLTPLILTLSNEDLCRAIRLGGFAVPHDENSIDDDCVCIEFLSFFAKRGLTRALHHQFEQEFPTRYPDDIDLNQWHTSTSDASAVFLNVWRGQVKW